MGNPHRGTVTLEADGKTYTLRFTTNALCELEARTSESIIALVERFDQPNGVSVKLVRDLMWAGLLDQHKLSDVDAGNLVDAVGFNRAGELIGEALGSLFDNEQEAGNGKAAAKTG